MKFWELCITMINMCISFHNMLLHDLRCVFAGYKGPHTGNDYHTVVVTAKVGVPGESQSQGSFSLHLS